MREKLKIPASGVAVGSHKLYENYTKNFNSTRTTASAPPGSRTRIR